MFHPLEETQDPENENDDTQLKDLLYKEVVVETEAPASPQSNGNIVPSTIQQTPPKSPKSESTLSPAAEQPIIAVNKTASIDAETIIKQLEVEASKESEKETPADNAAVEPVKPVIEAEPVLAPSPVDIDPEVSVAADEEKPAIEQVALEVSVPASSEETLVSASQPESPSTEKPEVSGEGKPDISSEGKPEISDEGKPEISDVVAKPANPEVSAPETDGVKLEAESVSVVVDDSPAEPEEVSTPALEVSTEEPETPAPAPVEISQEVPKVEEKPQAEVEAPGSDSPQAVEPSQSVVVVTTTEEEVISPDGSSSTTTTITEVVTIVDDKASIEIPASAASEVPVEAETKTTSEEIIVNEVVPVSPPSTSEDVSSPKTVESAQVVIEDNKEVTGGDKTNSTVADVEDLDIPSLDTGNSSLMDDITMELASSSP